ncbi:aldehyde dehydrogenase family protein [archaeon]|nr:MAG: aldehyde dehydrogenase family protein [archaeon]
MRVQFLAELGLAKENDGVYNGAKWGGAAAALTSYNPATGKPIAHVKQCTEAEYEECLSNMEAAKKTWGEVRPSR